MRQSLFVAVGRFVEYSTSRLLAVGRTWDDQAAEASLRVSRKRLGIPSICESNQLDTRTFGRCRIGTACTYSLSGKMCRHSLNDRRLGRSLAQ